MSLRIIAVASGVNNWKIYDVATLLFAAIYCNAMREYCLNDAGCKNVFLDSCDKQMKAKYAEIKIIIVTSQCFCYLSRKDNKSYEIIKEITRGTSRDPNIESTHDFSINGHF